MESNFKPIREILRRSDFLLHINGARDEYEYAYEKIGGAGGYQHINRARSVGWTFVSGDDPENAGMRDAQGNCVMGDVVLMKIEKSRLKEIQQELRDITAQQRGSNKEEDMKAKLDDALSKALGKPVSVVFGFESQAQIDARKRGA